MFAFLLGQISSKYVDITESDVDKYIGADKPIFVKFYSPTCPHCVAMAEEFANTASAYGEDFTFGAVDCTAQHKICNDHSVSGYPTVKLFKANDKKGIEFSGERNLDGFADFIEEHIDVKLKRPPKIMKEFTPYTLPKAEEGQCSFITFYAPYCGHCKRFIPTAKKVAEAFEFDENVTFGLVNCVKFHDVCSEHEVTGYPTIRLYQNGNFTAFNRDRSAQSVASFVNEHCGTHRAPDGLLDDKTGLVEGAYELAQKYIVAQTPEEASEIKSQIAALPGTQFYLKVIARIESKGYQTIANDMKQMRELLDNKKGSIKALDGMKQRFNVFTEFEKLPTQADVNALPEGSEKERLNAKLKRVATPTPAPTPEPAADSAAKPNEL
jgi:thiol-disulfide isomerase/thioredoxin